MEIRSRQELKFYLMADRMMNRGKFKPSYKDFILDLISPDYIMRYLTFMRKASYYSQSRRIINICKYYYKLRYISLQMKLGFTIGYDVFGYGLVIPHYGTIVVGSSNRIGNYAVLHTCTCITDNGKKIGDGLYCSTGSKITSKLNLGNNISIGANSLVNKSFDNDSIMIGGAPARYIKDTLPWYIRDGKTFLDRVNKIENLKKQFGL